MKKKIKKKILKNFFRIDNRLFELNTQLKHELNEVKLNNQKLAQDNIELLKSTPAGLAGAGAAGTSGVSSLSAGLVGSDKLRALEEQLFKTKDEVIDLQKKLVDVSLSLKGEGKG